jgi:hypothetical protein
VLNKATECYGKIDLATELSVLWTLRSTLHISKFFLMRAIWLDSDYVDVPNSLSSNRSLLLRTPLMQMRDRRVCLL